MTTETSNKSSGGIGFCGLLALMFICLKLTGFITWPWLWVLSPLWVGLALVAVVLLAITLWHVPIIIAALIRDIRRNRARKAKP